MRWERLFEDLEDQLAAEEARELAAEVADRTRRERALVGLHERFLAAAGCSMVELRVAGVGLLRGVVADAGADWVLLDHRPDHVLSVAPRGDPDATDTTGPVGASGTGRTRGSTPSSGSRGGSDRPVLVAVSAIRSATGLGGAEPTGAVAKGFGLGAALRAVSRDRAVVELVDVDGTRLTGTIDGVGQDYAEVSEHAADLPRRAKNVLAVRAVPFASLAIVRRRW